MIASYLGDPVAAPANLDARYSAQEISAVFRDLSETLGIKVDQLSVDTTEFPFIIHGRVASTDGADFFKRIDSELRGPVWLCLWRKRYWKHERWRKLLRTEHNSK